VAQAQQEINQSGGINNQLLQVEIANDNSVPEVAQQIATEFAKDNSILAVIGHNASEASIAAAPIYQQAGLVMISPTSVAKNLSGMGSYIFRTTPSSKAMATKLAEYIIKSAHKTKIAICYASKTEASQSFQEEFTTTVFENGGQITKIPCDFSDPAFNASTLPAQAISAGAEAVVLAPPLNGVNQAINVLQAAKGRLPIFGSQTMYAAETLKQGQTDANNMVLAVPWHPGLAADRAFTLNAKKLWGGAANWRTAMAYDATLAAITGLKSGTSRPQVQKALANPGFVLKGATGVVQFLPSGDRLMKVALVKVQPGKESGMSYDFVPVKTSVKKINPLPPPQTMVKTSQKPLTVAKKKPKPEVIAKAKPEVIAKAKPKVIAKSKPKVIAKSKPKVVTKKSPSPDQDNKNKSKS
jgi:branched-chain amino acid transport system substrate-binding protein